MARVTLILGGARSGKSAEGERRALARARAIGTAPVYLATAEPWDTEMAERIVEHQRRRHEEQGWRTVETPRDLPRSIRGEAGADQVLLVDCLTMWLTNLMMDEADVVRQEVDLLAALTDCDGEIILVSNEVGLGIVPENALARRFRDHAGALHQKIAAMADTVILTVAGLPLIVKQPGGEIRE